MFATDRGTTQIQDDIQKLKYKEPESTKIVILEQELVRAEAQSLVAEAQLTNITRQKLKEAYDLHTAGIIERAEKQIMLAQNARQLLNLLDDTPIVPGDAHPSWTGEIAGREILNDAEEQLKNWSPRIEPIQSNAGNLGTTGMPGVPAVPQHSEDAHTISPQEHAMQVVERERAQEQESVSSQQVQTPYPTETA